MALPYTIVIHKKVEETDSHYVAEIFGFDDYIADGDVKEDALKALREVKSLWLESRTVHGFPVPAPRGEDSGCSGKFNIRIPRELHRKLTLQTKMQNVSLNQYVLYISYAHKGCDGA